MRLEDLSTGKRYYCGRLRYKPHYVDGWVNNFYVTPNRQRHMEVKINGVDVTMNVHPFTRSKVVSFALNEGTVDEAWFYISDLDLHEKIFKRQYECDLKFVTSGVMEERAERLSRTDKLIGLLGGISHELIADSERINGEGNDCSVKAIMHALQIPYDEAHAMLEPHREGGKGLFAARFVYEKLGFKRLSEIPRKKMTVGTFAKRYTTGNYLVLVRGHVMAVVDGMIMDYQLAPGRLIENVMVKEIGG